MDRCEKCKWHEDCICVVCEDGKTVVCELQHKHVLITDCCDRFRMVFKLILK